MLLEALCAEPYLQRPPPKSTGRDLFHEGWLQGRLAAVGQGAAGGRGEDVMATLCEFSARAAADALAQSQPAPTELLVCGGGARTSHLLRRLEALCPLCRVRSTQEAGIPPEQVEALAFAWLAREFLARRPGNLPAVTGARGPRVLGALYPA